MKCPSCKNSGYVWKDEDANLVCNNCGYVVQHNYEYMERWEIDVYKRKRKVVKRQRSRE